LKIPVPQFLLLVIIPLFIFRCTGEKNKGSSEADIPNAQSEKQPQRQEQYLDTLATGQKPGNFNYLVEQYEDPERGEWQNPELVLQKLGELDDKVIADVGAGTGYFTFPLASEAEKVIAIDIDPRFLDYIEERKLDYPPAMSENVETRLSKENDPLLSESEADIVLMVNVYTFLEQRINYLEKVKRGMQDNGLLYIIDFKKGEMPVGPVDTEKIAHSEVYAELEQAGFQIREVDVSSLEYQYIIKAGKSDEAK